MSVTLTMPLLLIHTELSARAAETLLTATPIAPSQPASPAASQPVTRTSTEPPPSAANSKGQEVAPFATPVYTNRKKMFNFHRKRSLTAGSDTDTDTEGNTGVEVPGDPTQYKPLNPARPTELDLWNLEERRFVRSPIVISPDHSTFAYSEVIFSPHNRQTISRVYRVPIEQPPHDNSGMSRLPSEEVAAESETDDDTKPTPQWYEDRLDPEKTLQRREAIVQVGFDREQAYDFKTLTIVDWSPNGRRLLIKQKNGTFHVGLKTSNILVYDQDTGTTTIYPELRRMIAHHWREHSNMPDLNRLNWEIFPLGWKPGSDAEILVKAWALDPNRKKFLGVWNYNVDTHSSGNVSTENEATAVSSNGWAKVDLPKKPPPEPVVHKKKRRVEAKIIIN